MLFPAITCVHLCSLRQFKANDGYHVWWEGCMCLWIWGGEDESPPNTLPLIPPLIPPAPHPKYPTPNTPPPMLYPQYPTPNTPLIPPIPYPNTPPPMPYPQYPTPNTPPHPNTPPPPMPYPQYPTPNTSPHPNTPPPPMPYPSISLFPPRLVRGAALLLKDLAQYVS